MIKRGDRPLIQTPIVSLPVKQFKPQRSGYVYESNKISKPDRYHDVYPDGAVEYPLPYHYLT